VGFLRRWLGGEEASPTSTGEPGAGGEPDEEAIDEGAPPTADEIARAAELQRDYQAGLDDLARRQLAYERYAWQPPAQRQRDGEWILMVRWKVQSPEGKDVTLKPGSLLTWVGPGTMSPGAVRFRTEKGVLVDLPAGRDTDDGWPDDLQRPRSPTAGGDED